MDIPVYAYWDVDTDGSVNETDENLVTAALGQTGEDIVNFRTDVNRDGTVDSADLLLVTENLDPPPDSPLPTLPTALACPFSLGHASTRNAGSCSD